MSFCIGTQKVTARRKKSPGIYEQVLRDLSRLGLSAFFESQNATLRMPEVGDRVIAPNRVLMDCLELAIIGRGIFDYSFFGEIP
jgi:hypothetical protein